MSRNQRIALIVAALAVAVGAFLVLKPEDEDEGSRSAAVIRGDKDDPTTTPSGGGDAATPPPATETPPAEPPTLEIEVSGGEAVEPLDATVKSGERVRIVVSSDAAAEVHLHGYDIKRDAAPGAPAEFEFEADIEGVFEIEVEDTATQIGRLRVEP